MKKPKQHTKKFYCWSEIRDYIEDKYKIDTRDYANASATYCRDREWFRTSPNSPIPDWYDKEGNPTPVCLALSNTKQGNELYQKALKTYETDPDGKCKENPYQDFWHFMLDHTNINFMLDHTNINNGLVCYVDWNSYKHIADEQWQKDICDMFLKEFGDGEMEIMFSW